MNKKYLANWTKANILKIVIITSIVLTTAGIIYLNFSTTKRTNQTNATNLVHKCFNLVSDTSYLENYIPPGPPTMQPNKYFVKYKTMAINLALKLIHLYPTNPWGYLCFFQAKEKHDAFGTNTNIPEYLKIVKQYLKSNIEWAAYYRTLGSAIDPNSSYNKGERYFAMAYYYDKFANNKKGEVSDLIDRATFYNGIVVGSLGIPILTPYADKSLVYCKKALSLHVYSKYSSIYDCIADAYTTKGIFQKHRQIALHYYKKALNYYKKALNANEKYEKNILQKAAIYYYISGIYSFMYSEYKNNSKYSYFKKLAYIYADKSEKLFQDFVKHDKN